MNKFEFKNLTPFKWFVLENFPFIEADFDALTEWQLFCKIGKEINKIINSENTLGTQVENVTNAFIELQKFVNNYFDNLDVQEEINNKLNEMAEDGTLQEIITSYLQISGILAFNSISDMKQATNLINGSFVKTYGFYTPNDLGGAFYKVRTITNDDTIDDKTIIKLADNTLIAELILNSEMNIEQFGAYGDNIHDDTLAIQTAINKCNTLTFSKSYVTNGEIQINKPTTLKGINSQINASIENNQSVFHILSSNVNIYDIKIDITYTNPNANSQYGGGITIGSYYMNENFNLENIIVENVTMEKNINSGMTLGIFGDSHNIKILNCNIKKYGIGIHWAGNFLENHNPDIKHSYHPYNILIENCFLEDDIGIYCSGAYNVNINNCYFKNNSGCIQLVAGDVGDYLLSTENKNILTGINISNCTFNDCTDHTVFIKGYGTWVNGDNTFNPIENTKIKLSNCKFNDSVTNTAGALCRIDFINGLIIDNCSFITTNRINAIYATALFKTTISNCYFQVPGEPLTIFGGNNIIVKNCKADVNANHSFIRCQQYVFNPNSTTYKVSELVIENNNANNAFNMISFTNTRNTIVKNNILTNCAQGINYLEDNENTLVEGNRFSDIATDYIPGHYNVRCYKIINGIIKNNYLDGSTGILVDVNSDNFKISDNYMTNTFNTRGCIIEIPLRSNKNIYLVGNTGLKNTLINGSDYNYINYTENA